MKIPKIARYLFYGLALFMYTNCSVEEDLIELNKSIIHRKINFEEIKKNNIIMDNLTNYSKFMKQSSLKQKSIDSLVVDISFANYIETDDFISYTFNMPTTSVALRNFLLKKQKNSTGGFHGYVLNYNLTQEELILFNNLQLSNLNEKVTSIKIGNNFSPAMFGKNNKSGGNCDAWIGMCHNAWGGGTDFAGHPATSNECVVSSYQYQTIACSDGGSGGIGGGGGNDGINIVIVPTESSGQVEPIQIIDPCQQLDDLTNPALQNAKPALEDLKTLAGSSLNYENGYLFRKNASGVRTNEQITPNTTSDHAIPIKTGTTVYAAAHTHTYELFPMFSWQDLYVLYSLYQNSSINKSEATFIMIAKDCLTCATVSTYAIKIDNFVKFRAKINSDLNNSNTAGYSDADKFKTANDIYDDKFKPGMNNSQLEKAFLEYIGTHGVSLYKANDDLSNWDKLELSNSPLTPILKTPCH